MEIASGEGIGHVPPGVPSSFIFIVPVLCCCCCFFFIIVAAMMMIVVRPSSCVLADRALAAVRSARPMRKYTTL